MTYLPMNHPETVHHLYQDDRDVVNDNVDNLNHPDEGGGDCTLQFKISLQCNGEQGEISKSVTFTTFRIENYFNGGGAPSISDGIFYRHKTP